MDSNIEIYKYKSNKQLHCVDRSRADLVNDQHSKNDSRSYNNGCEDMYYENMNNANYLQHDIQFEAFQGGGSSDSRAPELKKFWVYNLLGELKWFFAAISMEGLGYEGINVMGRQVKNSESIAYVLFNIVSNHGERNQWALHMKGEQGSDLQGFFWCTQERGDISLKPMDRDIDQYMEVVKRGCLLIQDNSKLQYITNQAKQEAKNTYREYKKQRMAWERHGCSYEKYMQYVIDDCIARQVEKIIIEGDDESKKIESQPLTNARVKEKVGTHTSGCVRVEACTNYDLSDYNIPTKKVGYFAMENTDFRFVGPDRLPVTKDSIDKCLQVANIIKNTGLPNYHMATIPLTSGLNIPAWERELQGYRSEYNSFVAACVYRPPGSCTTQFLEDFLAFCLQSVQILSFAVT